MVKRGVLERRRAAMDVVETPAQVRRRAAMDMDVAETPTQVRRRAALDMAETLTQVRRRAAMAEQHDYHTSVYYHNDQLTGNGKK